MSKIEKIIKRSVDISVSLIVLLLNLPVFGILAVLIKLDSPGFVVYVQNRVGKNGKHFLLYKLRTMIPEAERETGPVWALPNDLRITRIGRLLRRWRMDEIPQFWNVLKGDMSLIGPRPERPHFIEILAKEIPSYHHRHQVQPGITGWAQVKLGYSSSFEAAKLKFQHDLWYIRNMSLLLDLKIAIQTIVIIINGKGR